MVNFSSLLYIYFIFSVVNGQKFGYNDRYTCHCKNSNNCDQETERCNDGCIQGWFGPNCQKENVALNKNTTQSSQYEDRVSGFAVDGKTYNKNDAICSHTAVPDKPRIDYWQVDLGQIYPIREIKIYIRAPYANRLRGYYIDMVFINGSSTVCQQPSSDIPGLKFTINVNCEGRYLRISNTVSYNTDTFVNLCEVEIYVCAAGTYGPNCDNFCYCQSVDERCTDGICPNGCAPGFTTPGCNTSCYGNGCQFLCSNRKCENNTSLCDIDTGVCNGGCQISYQPPDCRLQCSDGTYGDQCVNQCSDRRCMNPTSSCNAITGECIGGCSAGYTGTDCRQECDKDIYYGSQCLKVCSHRNCSNTSSGFCDHVTGLCDGGCKPGYGLDDCSAECTDRKYGMNCQYDCDDRNCNNNTQCDFISGICEGGCQSGYKNDDCALRIEQKEGLSTGALVGIVVAFICIIIVAVIIFIVLKRRRLPRKQYDKPDANIGQVVTYNQIQKKDKGPIYENSESVQMSKVGAQPQSPASPPKQTPTNIEVKAQGSKTAELDNTYCNSNALPSTNVIEITMLKEQVSKLKNFASSYDEIYQKLPSGFTSAYDNSQIEANRPKNRFKGYYPYDYNRVILNKDKDDPHSDYINASYVDSYNQPNYFIAAQGPTKVTIQDFVRMIFEEKCKRVLMLTNLVESAKNKCERYWPLKKKEEFGNITVTLVEETIHSYYIVRKLTLENKENGKVHETTQFHFTAWLDHDVPRTVQLLDFLYHVEDHKTSDTPVLVHCSAGIGRTGTYLAIDSLLKEGRETGRVDIQLCIKKMRMQRKDMIQTADQLKFVYEALAEAFETGRTDVPVASYEELLKSDQSFSLTQLSRTDEFRLLQATEKKTEKNRIFIPSYPNITVYRAMSVRNSRGYFISDLTGHDKETIWNLIMDEECEVVVYFSNKATTQIIPDSNKEDIVKYKLLSGSSTKLYNDIQLYTIQIQSENDGRECKVLVVQTKQLHDKSSLTSALTELVYQVGLLDSTSTPVAVFHQSVRLAAMFCITRNITQRIKDNNEVEILNSTRQILEILPNAVNNMDDYNALYGTVSNVITSQNVYQNI